MPILEFQNKLVSKRASEGDGELLASILFLPINQKRRDL